MSPRTPDLSSALIRRFRRKVLDFYRKRSRDLPFRHTTDPYHITVCEVMLHQTQVDRVLPRYRAWVERWPDWHSLAAADRRQVLAAWSGLGYNRRALYLRDIARIVVHDYGGELPDDYNALCRLPGIGPYTANAILIFVFNRRAVAIDTNVRRVLIHELHLSPGISPRHLEEIARLVLPTGEVATWHHALMDYSAMVLPRRLPSAPARSKQSTFRGSLRQVRGEIVRQLTRKTRVKTTTVAQALHQGEPVVRRAARALEREGMVAVRGQFIYLAE